MGASEQMGVAAAAGAVSAMVVSPAELVMITQQRVGGTMTGAISEIWATQGLSGLMRGIVPTIIREAGWVFGFLGLSPTIKVTLQDDSRFFRRNDLAASAASSAVAGLIAGTITCPADVVKSMMQGDRGINSPIRYKSTFDTARQLYRKVPPRPTFCGCSRGRSI